MRIALFGDVHGNRFALDAVAQDIESLSPDAWVNLGDGLFGGADPAGAWELQQQLRVRHHVLEVRGNTDERLAQPLAEVTEKRGWLTWLHGVLPEEARRHVGGLALTGRLADGEVLVAHGSPSSAWEYLLLDDRGRWAEDDVVRSRLRGADSARVVVVGHSHLEHVRQLGGVTVVNAGAVSRQDDGCPDARWVLLERVRGRWNVSFRRVAYDVEAAADWAQTHAHHGDREARQLRTGRKNG